MGPTLHAPFIAPAPAVGRPDSPERFRRELGVNLAACA